VFCFPKSRINENGGKESLLISELKPSLNENVGSEEAISFVNFYW